MSSCVFCDIVKGREKAYKIYEDDVVVVILDKYPVTKGHLLVISKKHYESVHDADPKTIVHAFSVASALAKIYRNNLKASGVNVLTNSGEPAGQIVFHFHVHVIPRWHKGGFSWTSRHLLTEDEANEVINMLRPYLKSIDEFLKEVHLK
jgi:histidine triad (HIT) family protein